MSHGKYKRKVSLGFRVYDAHMNLPARGPTSMNLPACSFALRTSPLVVLLNGPPRTQLLSSVSTEHTNLPRSYPHMRVIGYEPPCSYHHVFTTIHEPTAHGITSPDPSFTSQHDNENKKSTLRYTRYILKLV
ncbi:hypothetical protein DEO72_LG6g1998 [Vigna unguiculata]|uniref:Uncharacterized protein n=1 Tax=Vigna unguiculata TaxID=3917 RepID=A0A4D6MA65_VIGUN|nr:hypothetical protein DEO72_LG6g1998 [Vigna unguiculata]